MRSSLRTLPATVVTLATISATPSALSHSGGFGGPAAEASFSLPLWVVWALGALIVALSFVLVGLFLTREELSGRAADEHGQFVRSLVPGRFGLWTGVVLLLLLVPPLALGSSSRLPEVLVWLGAWSILPMLAYAAGDVWRHIDPFAALSHRLKFQGRWRYPPGLGSWPSVALLLALIGLEVLPGWGHEGRPLTLVLLAYAVLTLFGLWAFGGDAWRENVEVFSRFFRWWSAVAPFRVSRRGVHVRRLKEIGRSLPVHRLSDVAFTVALLYGVNFDGFLATRLGGLALDRLEMLGPLAAHVFVLVLGYVAFLAAYLLSIRAVRRHADSLEDTVRVAGRFALSLLPIAVGYHLAHNAFYAVEYLPAALEALADPWGLRWGIAATMGSWSPTLPSATLTGWIQLSIIIVAHVAAVLLAHELAFTGFTSRVQAARSEVPLTLVMVFYTFVGLAIVSSGYQATPGV